jgi:CheY-like chemotaxis protein
MGNAVLLVHSDHLPRELARQALESAGHTVAEAADVPSGVRVAQTAYPDLLLMATRSTAFATIRPRAKAGW